ncbi:TPA: restriction endonuclease subunit S [Haemophilus influenzae 10810]
MSDWQTVTLEDVTESINTGLDAIRRAPIVEHKTNLRCLRIQDISQNKPFDKWGYTEVKDSDFKKFQLVPNDIIMARTCSTGICYLVKKELPAVFNNGLARIRLKIEKVDPKFIYYVFKSKHFSGYIDGISGGTSVQLNMKIGDLLKYQFNLPPLSKQKEIARILSDLDKKIELNTQINQTLEQIAQALFKSWFVDFEPVRTKVQALSEGMSLEQAELAAMQTISGKTPEELTALSQTQPEHYAELAETAKAFPCEMVEVDWVEVPKGWEYQYLKDICNIVYGKNLPTTKLIKEGYPVFGGNGVIGYYDKFLYETPQTLVSCRGAASGKVLYSLPYSFVTNNSLVIEHEKSGLSYFYIYEVLKLQNLTELTSGSAQPQMTIANMTAVQILVPSEKINEVCKKYLGTLYNQIYQNNIENETLAQTRDLLLPKLLNGDI